MEPATPAVAAKLVMTVILAIAANFQQGLQHLDKKEYDPAIAKLTAVYEQDVPGNTMREVALFYRAHAHAGKAGEADMASARADLKLLIMSTTDPVLNAQAREYYVACGGKPEDLVPEQTPKMVWEAFKEAVAKEDAEAALAHCQGQWQMIAKQLVESKNLNQLDTWELTESEVAEDLKSATIMVNASGQELKIGCVLVGGKWIMSTFEPVRRRGVRARVAGDAEMNRPDGRRVNNLGNIKQICLGLLMYSGDHGGHFPPSLKTLKDEDVLDEGKVYQWTHPETGETTPFVYYPGFKDDNDDATRVIIIAAPMVFDGKRECGFVDGHAELVPEERFRDQLKKQGSKVEIVVANPEDIPADVRATVEALVVKLGARDAETRAAARKELEKMGDTALPALTLYRDHDDPEIRMTVRAILGE